MTVKVVNNQTGEVVKSHSFENENEAYRSYNYYVFNLDHANFDLVMED